MDDAPDAPEVSARAQRLKEEVLGDFSLRVDDVAAILEVDRTTVNRYIQDGALVALKIGREYRLSEPDVRDFLQALVSRERQRVGAIRMRALAGEPDAKGGPAAASVNRVLGRYDERAQRAVARAQALARTRGAREVGPEHLLLALVADESGEAPEAVVAALRAQGVDVAALREAVEALAPAGEGVAEDAPTPDFGRACRDVVVERAPAIMRRGGRTSVEPQDILLALYAVRSVGDALRAAGASEAAMRMELHLTAPAPALASPEQPLRDDVTAMSVWVQAHAEAWQRGSALVAAPHVLLAVLADVPGLREGGARQALEAVGADLDALRAAAEGVLPPGPALPPASPPTAGATVLSRGGFDPGGRPLTLQSENGTIVISRGGVGAGSWGEGEGPAPTRRVPRPALVLARQLREVDYHAFRAADAMGHGQVGAEHVLLGLWALPDMAGILGSAGVGEPELRDAVWRVREAAPALQRELSCAFNNVGISDDADPQAGDLDGDGASFSRQALQTAGLVTGQTIEVDGLSFEWPAAAPGTPDNVLARGQVVPLAVPPGAERLGFLGTASKRAARGVATVLYDDGTVQRISLGFGDWVRGGHEGRVVASAAYRNARRRRHGDAGHIYFAEVSLRAGRTPTHLVLPPEEDGGRMHVFAVAAG